MRTLLALFLLFAIALPEGNAAFALGGRTMAGKDGWGTTVTARRAGGSQSP